MNMTLVKDNSRLANPDCHLVLVTQSNLQGQNLKRILATRTQLPATIIDAENVHSAADLPDNILLIYDCSSHCSDICYSELCCHKNLKGCVLLNVTDETTVADLCQWRSLRGVFGVRDSIERVCDGILAIARGDNWLPRRLTSQLLDYLQQNQNPVAVDHNLDVELTRREIQVLQYLKDGSSNNSIAQSLFVSEHTVKSHLYNIFRKIDVKNRAQARVWANKYL